MYRRTIDGVSGKERMRAAMQAGGVRSRCSSRCRIDVSARWSVVAHPRRDDLCTMLSLGADGLAVGEHGEVSG